MFCLQRNFFNPTVPVDEQLFYELVRDKESNAMIDGFRQSGNAELKRKLPALIFQATFDETTSKSGKKGAWRKQSATRLTGLVVLDIDHVENPKELIEEWMSNIDFEKWGILFIYITPSGKGIKVVFKANILWGNLADNQIEMAKLLGVEADESGKDASRMSFICKEEDIQFIDQELFTYENKEFADKYNAQYRNGNSNPVNHTDYGIGKSAENHDVATAASGQVANKSGALAASQMENTVEVPSFKGIPYTAIIDKWWAKHGGIPQEGERNVKLYNLAVNLRAICDNNKELLLQIMPRLGLNEQEFQSIIDSACKEQPKGISKLMREIIGSKDEPIEKYDDDIEKKLWLWGKELENLSQYYPILKDVTKGLKQNQFTAAFFVAGALLMTLMTRCTYRFYHRPEELRRLNSSVIIEGDPASGKSFATRLYKLLMAPVFAADKEGKKAINAYRELVKTKGANKEKPNKPKVVVRIHPARTSNAQFIQDMVNSVEVVDGEEMQLHMLTFDTELDNTLCLQKGGSWIDKISLELKAFHNEEDGQAYSNVDSVLQDFIVTWNYIYTGTPLALKKKVNERNFGSGLATRLTCIPLPSTNFEMLTREVSVDYESDERLKEWAYKLDRTKGELSLRKIIDALFDWTERRMADAAYNESKADEMLLKRCAYHGVNFAAPFIIMRHWDELKKDGEFWCGAFGTDEIDQRLAELIVNIQFACQKHYFGAMAEKYFDDKTRDAAVNRQRQQKTIDAFNRLPEDFTVYDVMRCFDLNSTSAARMRIARLLKDRLVEKVGEVVKDGHQQSLYNKTGYIMIP
ncbi:MAG: hypothetical protein E7100_07135 [Bacteroidaceae bacterium]|nr:hypothetical protein [Bacteroidaceae bacterium]